MKFVFEKLLETRDTVASVDGAFRSRIQLSHWPANLTPKELKADTSTEIAFKLLESKRKEDYLRGVRIVSNNHIDADGVLAAYVLLFPEEALKRKRELIDIATTGDFAEYTTDSALKAAKILNELDHPQFSIFREEYDHRSFPEIMQSLYEKALEMVPNLVENIDWFEKFYREDYHWFQRSEAAFEEGGAFVTNYKDCHLSVIESAFELHPVSKVKRAAYDIILTAVELAGLKMYELYYKSHTWFETTREKHIERKSFEPLVEKLNQMNEDIKSSWKVLGINPFVEWDYRLQYSNEDYLLVPCELDIADLEKIMIEYFYE